MSCSACHKNHIQYMPLQKPVFSGRPNPSLIINAFFINQQTAQFLRMVSSPRLYCHHCHWWNQVQKPLQAAQWRAKNRKKLFIKTKNSVKLIHITSYLPRIFKNWLRFFYNITGHIILIRSLSQCFKCYFFPPISSNPS